MLALGTGRESEVFSSLEYAVALSLTPVNVEERLVERLREDLNEREFLELTTQITYGNHRARFSRAYDLPASGRSEGSVCPIPDHRVGPVPESGKSASSTKID